MFASLRKNRRNVPLIGDIVFSMLTLPVASAYLDEWVNENLMEQEPEASLFLLMLAFCVVVGIAQLFRAFRLRARGKADFNLHLIHGIVFLACAALLGVFGYTRWVVIVIGVAYWLTLISGRVLSIVRRRRVWNTIANVVLILASLIALGAMFLPGYDAIFIAVMFECFHALLTIFVVVFSKLKLGALKEIIKKTYALEIILCLLLLIFCCAWLLTFTEEGLPTYGDALWYCFAVVTTIGFGDFTVTTIFGRVISVILGIYGIIVVALITSIIVNFYGEMKKTETGSKDPDAPAS